MPNRGDEDNMALLGSSDPGHRQQTNVLEMVRACFCEFLATAFFVFVGVTSIVNNSRLDDHGHVEKTDIVGVALAHGLMIFLLISITGHVSGGHINPAVSFGVWMAGEISFIRFLLYSASQMIGATLGSGLSLLFNKDLFPFDYGVHNPVNGVHPGLAFCIEIMTTFVVVSTVLAVAVEPKGPQALIPLCIGMAVCAGILASATITGGSMNPARSFGPAVTSLRALSTHSDTYPTAGGAYYGKYWKNQWIYMLAPMIGGGLAAINFRFVISTRVLQKPHLH